MCTLIYSIKSHRKIVHYPHCSIIHRIAKGNRRTFESIDEAQAQGYMLCNCCPPIAQRYRKERGAVDDCCAGRGLTLYLHDGIIDIFSRHDCWKLITKGQKNGIFLYHKNNLKKDVWTRDKNRVPGYHLQAFRSGTILGYLEYIDSHDSYRDAHPYPDWMIQDGALGEQEGTIEKKKKEKRTTPRKGTKRYRKEQAKKKRKERDASIKRVYALLNEISAARSEG